MAMLAPPAGGQFQSRESLIEFVRTFGASNGYAISIARSKERKVYLCCDRSGKYRNRLNLTEETRRKNTSSRLIECPFSICGTKGFNNIWTLSIRDPTHCHGPSENIAAHPSLRRLDTQAQRQLSEMTRAGVRPREILSSLRQNNPLISTTSRDIYNIRTRLRQENLRGRTSIQALIEELKKGQFEYDYKYDSDGHVTHLFFSHYKSIELVRSYSSVLLMDCTYKTNKFKMPLLNVVSVTSFNTTFFVCFVFIKDEKEEDYVWALSRISRLFNGVEKPNVIVTDRELALMRALERTFSNSKNLLCLWHIEKNILAKCKSHFYTEEQWIAFLQCWTGVVKSKTDNDFTAQWTELCTKYNEFPLIVNYIQDTWLPLKEKFISAWADQYFHLGTTVTSRVEGAHATLKRYLQVSVGNLQLVYEKISLLLENQHNEIKEMVEKNKTRIPHSQNIPFYSRLVSHISLYALKKIHEQFIKASHATYDNPLEPCTGTFTTSMGLPCAHIIQERLANNQLLDLNDIHQHWWINNYHLPLQSQVENEDNSLSQLLEEFRQQYTSWSVSQQEVAQNKLVSLIREPSTVLLDPTVQRTKGRPAGSLNKIQSSTRRNPSAFEIEDTRTNGRKCGICKRAGHNSRTCPNRTTDTF